MHARKNLVIWLLMLLTATALHAKKPELPEPDPTCGSIGIGVEFGAFSGGGEVVTVYFVKLGPEGEADRIGDLIESNYDRRGQFYLLNAEPGRYVAVGVTAVQKGGTTPVASSGALTFGLGVNLASEWLFDDEVIRLSEVEVTPGRLVHMGDFRLKHERIEPSRLTDLQLQSYHQLKPKRAAKGKKAVCAELKGVEQGVGAQRAFWEKAVRKAFKKQPPWKEQARRELAAVGQ
jgi:hypothetical protein